VLPYVMVLIARLLLFIQIVIIAAVLGAAVIFFGTIVLAMMFGASDEEGALAMGAAGLMPAGAVIGAGLGAWLAWRMLRRMKAASIMAGGYGLAGLAALSAGGWLLYEDLSDGNPYPQGKEPVVQIEWRLPETVPHAQVKRVFRFMMRSSYMNWILSTEWDSPAVRDEDGHSILRWRGQIRWRVTGRTFQMWRAPLHNVRITVDLNLPRDPKPAAEYGPWQQVRSAPGHAFRTRIAGG